MLLPSVDDQKPFLIATREGHPNMHGYFEEELCKTSGAELCKKYICYSPTPGSGLVRKGL